MTTTEAIDEIMAEADKLREDWRRLADEVTVVLTAHRTRIAELENMLREVADESMEVTDCEEPDCDHEPQYVIDSETHERIVALISQGYEGVDLLGALEDSFKLGHEPGRSASAL